MDTADFSYREREKALRRFREELFDVLVIGGGITGAAVARDAASRGLKVALVEKNDFAFGTSSRSSKLIHGGLRYLENLKFGLVFESLSERAFLLNSVPHMVRPLEFYWPVYEGDRNGRFILTLGFWLYDFLALFRSPKFHRGLSRKEFLRRLPFIKKEGLKGGFNYSDASMCDDVLTVETLRSAYRSGAVLANYVEAIAPLWSDHRIKGFRLRDREKRMGEGEIDIKCRRVILCAGPWTDRLASAYFTNWQPILSPSRGLHLVFDAKKIPVSGAVVMNNPEDGRISFVIPRPDFGSGVVIVGTTDGPSAPEPEKTEIEPEDVRYLMALLKKYFSELSLDESDILSAYVGVRPLVGDPEHKGSLQKVSREHQILKAPGGMVVVAGGKYTTHRKMAEEIVDFTLQAWQKEERLVKGLEPPEELGGSRTLEPVNPKTVTEAVERCRERALERGLSVPDRLYQRYGAEAVEIMEIERSSRLAGSSCVLEDPEGFPLLGSQLRHAIRNGMVLHLEDFYFRRTALFAARADHGMPWAEMLSEIWAEERGLTSLDAQCELDQLTAEVKRRTAWVQRL